MINVEKIVVDIEREFADKLGQAEDPALRDRVTDIQDVLRRILGHLLERQRPGLHDLSEDIVLVARDLLPSDMISMNRKRVKAVVTESGGRTSHIAILARAFEIPAVLGVAGAVSKLRLAAIAAVDGDRGLVVGDPDPETIARSAAARSDAAKRQRELVSLRDLPAETKDGKRLSWQGEHRGARGGGRGARPRRRRHRPVPLGVPVPRSPTVPDEEEQLRGLHDGARGHGGGPSPSARWTSAGTRSCPSSAPRTDRIRSSGGAPSASAWPRPDVFRTQLRALLRASVHGDPCGSCSR